MKKSSLSTREWLVLHLSRSEMKVVVVILMLYAFMLSLLLYLISSRRRDGRIISPARSGGYMLYARALSITWGTREYWDWNCFKETGEENIEVARLSHVCWVDVRGIVYDVFCQVKLTKGGCGWELPITLRLSLPDGRVQHHQVSLLRKPRGEWMELSVGNFQAQLGEDREVCFDLYEHGGHWKNGLIVKAAILRPKT